MNPKKHQTNFQQVSKQAIGSLLIGSIVGGAVLTNGAAMANPIEVAPSQAIGKLSANDASINPNTAPTNNIAQASDIAGNWAEPFIKILVEKGIIAGYPDGTFKPDQPVTREEFAALLNKAFDLQATRGARNFKDVSKKAWSRDVIQKAYRAGYLAGFPNGTFAPKQNIQRIQSVVALINGNKIEPKAQLDINSVFGDAAQVPGYGQNALVAATQGCIAVSSEFDSSKLPGGNFNPTGTATRADVAAFLHQVLVGTGKLQPLAKESTGNKYIASCPGGTYVATITPEAAPTPPQPAAPTAEEAIAKLSVPTALPELIAGNAVTTFPVTGFQSPSAFGANWGEVFIGGSYQGSTRPSSVFAAPVAPATQGGVLAQTVGSAARAQQPENYNAGIGFGIGDAKNFLGLETVYQTVSVGQGGFFNRNAVSFKLHKQFGDNVAIAAGWENAINSGVTAPVNNNTVDGGSSKYGVLSLVLNPDANQGFFSNTTLSVGAGDGRFNSIDNIIANRDDVNVFGSLGTRLFPGVSVVADWNGQDLGVALPITLGLGSGASFQVTPAIVDLTNEKSGGSRFVLGGGFGFRF